MHFNQAKQGFTLIELLVVVLIIGILAAVALPQYRKAITKSRLAQVDVAIDIAKKNIDTYLLANGMPSSGSVYFTGPSNVGDLEMPGNCDTANSVYCYTSVGGFMVMCNSSRCRVIFMPSFNADGTSGNKALPGETTFTLEYTRAGGWYISSGASTPAVEICEWIDSHAEYKVKSTVKTRCANVGRTLSNQEAS